MPPKGGGKTVETRKSKRARGDSSSGSALPNLDLSIVPGNRFIFRDDEAYRTYHRIITRKLSGCYYFDPNGKLGAGYLAKIYGWIDHLSMRKLTTITDTCSELSTRLFYANLRVNAMHDATSYFHGKIIDLSFPKLAEILEMPNDGTMEYPHKNWPWDSENAIRHESDISYRKWFGFSSKKEAYVTDLPALHRITLLFVNNILTPKFKIKTNVEKGALFFMRHMIEMDDLQFHIPYVIINHMHKAHSNSRDSLPYGNVIHFILKEQGIENPLQGISEGDRIKPKNVLNYFSDWVQIGDFLIPNPNDPRNKYLMTPGAAPNQYHPLGGEAPKPVESEPEPEPEPEPESEREPAPQTASTSQTGNAELMAYLTSQFQTINQTIQQYATDSNDRYTRLENRLNRYETEANQRHEEYNQQYAKMNERFDYFETRFDTCDRNFKDLRDSGASYHQTVNDFWIDTSKQFEALKLGASTSRRGDDDDDDDPN